MYSFKQLAHTLLQVVKFLCETQFVDINSQDRWGCTPLRECARHTHVQIVDWLRGRGATLGTKAQDAAAELQAMAADGDEAKALIASATCDICCETQHTQVLSLIASGVEVNSTDYDGRTALHLAASEGHETVVEALLQAGANPALQDRSL